MLLKITELGNNRWITFFYKGKKKQIGRTFEDLNTSWILQTINLLFNFLQCEVREVRESSRWGRKLWLVICTYKNKQEGRSKWSQSNDRPVCHCCANSAGFFTWNLSKALQLTGDSTVSLQSYSLEPVSQVVWGDNTNTSTVAISVTLAIKQAKMTFKNRQKYFYNRMSYISMMLWLTN